MLAVKMEGLEYNIKELNKVHIQKSKSSRLRKKVLISTVLLYYHLEVLLSDFKLWA